LAEKNPNGAEAGVDFRGPLARLLIRQAKGIVVSHSCARRNAREWGTEFELSFLGNFLASLLWLIAVFLAIGPAVFAQSAQPADSTPIAIVPLAPPDNTDPAAAPKVTGALEVSQGRAVIVASGTVTSGNATTQVVLPRRGVLRVCASTTVKLAADASVPAGEVPGLLMAMDQGAVEASFATGRNSDILLTPDFRILIGGPGAAEVRVRLGQHGDTCVENAGVDAPYVLVSSVFGGGAYRVQAGQRVMFQHGSLHEVVDNEKEPCGCPPALKAAPQGNDFPLAQSEGLAPLPAPALPNPAAETAPAAPLVYSRSGKGEQPASGPQSPASAPAVSPPKVEPPAASPPQAKKKTGFFGRVGSFFRHLFGAES
jgi:hypothetical protein